MNCNEKRDTDRTGRAYYAPSRYSGVCPRCDGKRICNACDGSKTHSYRSLAGLRTIECPACSGIGTCPVCGGTGTVGGCENE